MNVQATVPEAVDLDAARQVLLVELGRTARLVLLLRYAEDLSFAEIAQVLGLTAAGVERLYGEAMAVLEERFA